MLTTREKREMFLDGIATTTGWAVGLAFALLVLALFNGLTGCAVRRAGVQTVLIASSPAVSRDSLAKLPAYLVPAPAGSTRRQQRQWQAAQVQALANTGAVPAKVKVTGHGTVASAGATVTAAPQKVKVTGRGTVASPGATVVNAQKADAPVTFGYDNLVQDFTKAGAHGGAVATAPGATAGVTRAGVPAWQLVAGALLFCFLLFLLFKRRTDGYSL